MRIFSFLLATCACAPPAATLELVSLAVDPLDDCIAASGPREAAFLLDIGADPSVANAFGVFLQGELSILNTDQKHTFIPGEASTFFTFDEGSLGDDLPRSRATARIGPTIASIINRGASASPTEPLFVAAVTREEAVALQTEPDIANALTTTSDRVQLVMHIEVAGVAVAGDGSLIEGNPSILDVVSKPFVASVELCIGCLVPTCVDGETLIQGGCFGGLDVASVCQPR